MKMRWEVSETTWLEQFAELPDAPVDYLLVDLDQRVERPWLEEARDRVELIGRCADEPGAATVERALELDVDFLCLPPAAGELDARRLPLRLIVEQDFDSGTGSLAGAAWARRVHAWGGVEPARLEALARAERIFLVGHARLPEPAFLQRLMPFAVAVPDGVTAPELAPYIAL